MYSEKENCFIYLPYSICCLISLKLLLQPLKCCNSLKLVRITKDPYYFSKLYFHPYFLYNIDLSQLMGFNSCVSTINIFKEILVILHYNPMFVKPTVSSLLFLFYCFALVFLRLGKTGGWAGPKRVRVPQVRA